MVHWLTVIERESPGHGVWELVRELSDEEYQHYIDAVNQVSRNARGGPYSQVADAFRKYWHWWDQLTRAYVALPPDKQLNIWEISHEATTNIFGILAAMRRYLDHTHAYLSRSGQQDAVEAFKAARSKEYDAYFAYRLVYRLRNFEQHISSAVTIHSEASLPDEDAKVTRPLLSVRLDRDRLLHDFDGWSTVRSELETQVPEIDVEPILRQVAECLNRIAKRTIAAEIPGMVEAARMLDGLIREAQDKPGVPTVLSGPREFFEEGIRPGQRIDIRTTWIPIGRVNRLLGRHNGGGTQEGDT
jgi:hypothetical protein